jgi:hypothetical protein
MSFNWTGAMGGLLGAAADEAKSYQARADAMKQKQIEQAIADRKEKALLAKEEALMKYNYYREDQKDIRDEKNRAATVERDDKKIAAQEKAADQRHSALMAGITSRSEKDSADEKKLKMIENDPTLSAEEKVAARKKLYGIDDKKKGEMTEYQQMQAEEKLAEIESMGIDESNVGRANAIRKRIGMPLLKKVETKPGKSGILGTSLGSDEPEYGYVEDYDSLPDDKSKGKPAETKADPVKEEAAAPKSEKEEKKPTEAGGLDKYLKVLKGGDKTEKTDKAEVPVTKTEDGILGDAATANTDLGSVLGQVINGGVKIAQLAPAALVKLNAELEAALATANQKNAQGLMDLAAEVKKVMSTKEKIAPNAAAFRSR